MAEAVSVDCMLSQWKAKLEGCGDDMIETQVYVFTIHTNTQGLRLRFFSPWDQVSESFVFRQCVYSIRLNDRPKRCKTPAFKPKSVSVWMAPETNSQPAHSLCSRKLIPRPLPFAFSSDTHNLYTWLSAVSWHDSRVASSPTAPTGCGNERY